MSRVTHSTFRAAAASGLVLVALGLSACGGGSKDQGATPSTPAATPSATTATTPAKTTPPKTASIPAVLKSTILVTKEGQKAIDAASDATRSKDALTKQANEILTRLKKSGFPDAKQGVGSATGPVVIQTGKATTVLVYPTDKAAARQTVGFALVLANAKTAGRMARDGNVLVATSAPKGLTSALKKEFAKARAATSQV